MNYQPQIEQREGKDYIFCVWRRKYVRLTPEEWVRQQFLHALVEDFAYPQSLIAVEVEVGTKSKEQRTRIHTPSAYGHSPYLRGRVNGAMSRELKKRCDAIVYNSDLRPLCIIEFKAPAVTLSQRVFDQVAVYNRRLGVSYFFLSNGKSHQACRVLQDSYECLPNIPIYTDLCQTTL